MEDRGSAPGRSDRHRPARLAWEAGWPQEPAQPRIDAGNYAKQEKILPQPGRRRSARLLTGRRISRTTRDFFPPASATRSAGLAPRTDGWISARAQGRLYSTTTHPKTSRRRLEKCARSGGKARAVAMSIEDRRTDNWQQQAASLGDDRIRYLSGGLCGTIRARSLENSRSLPTCTAASPIPKTCPGSLEKVLSLLETGGVFYTIVQNVHLDGGKDKPDN